MSDLRNKIIRLAKENPKLRTDLLPLLGKEAAKTFDPKSYKQMVLKEIDRFIKTNAKQREQWKKAHTELHILYNITFDKDQKERIKAMLLELKGDILRTLNSEKENLAKDFVFVGRMYLTDPEDIRQEIAYAMKSEKSKNAALYHLGGF